MSKFGISSGWKGLGSRLAPWFVLLAALVQTSLGFHHHDDLRIHDDCRVCLVGHQGPELDSLHPVEPVLARGPVEYLALGLGKVPVALDSPAPSARGPPSSV